MRHRLITSFLLMLLGTLALPVPAHAQYTTGRIEGVVTDSTGSVVPGATATLRSRGTNQTRTAQTDESGLYGFAGVPPGDYDITVQLEGFTPATVTFTMVTNQVVTQNLVLQVGGASESIDVRGQAAGMMNTQEAQIGITRLEREIKELPNLNRNVTGLAAYTPGVQPTQNPRGGSLAIASGSQAGFIAASGGRARATAVQLDYTDVNDWEFGGIALGTSPMIDAIQEFKVLTSNFAAEQGVKSNAQVIIVTKSGTNDIHGTAYDFIQNNAFNARDYFDRTGQTRPIKRNNYGFTIGAPIVSNRTFIFGGWEATKNRGASSTTIATVPTAAARARATSPAARELLDLLPLPQAGTSDPDIGTISSSFSAPQDSWQYITKVDHQLTANQSLSGRWLHSHNLSILRYPALNTLPGFDSDFDSGAKNLSLSHTWVASPRLLNQLRFAYGRSSGLIMNEGGLDSPRITITGLVNFGALNFFPNTRVFDVFQVNDAVTYTRGSHTYRAGFDIRQIADESLLSTNEHGLYVFPSLNAFLAGQASSWTQLFGEQTRTFTTGLYGLFAQDDWRLSSNLTLNLGVRWEIQGAMGDADDLSSVLELDDRSAIGQAGTGPLGAFRVGNPTIRRNASLVSPRVGFAWTTQNAKTVVRGGWGLFYDSFNFTPQTFSRGVPPLNYNFALQGSQIAGANSFDNLYNGTAPIVVGAEGQVGGFGDLRNFGEITTINPNMKNPYSQHVSLGVEFQPAALIVGRIGYVGTIGRNLTMFVPINPSVSSPAPAANLADEQARLAEFTAAVGRQNGPGNNRLDPRFDQVSYHTDTAESSYNSLQFEATKRAGKEGLLLRVAYTWSKSMDTASDFTTEQQANDNNYLQEAGNLANERAVSNYDIPHRFVLTTIWDLPFWRDKPGILGRAFGGWSWQTTNLWQSGVPGTLLSGSRLGIADTNLDGNLIPRVAIDNTRANCADGAEFALVTDASSIPAPALRGVNGTANSSNYAFTQPLLGQNGTCGRNSVRLNSLTNMDWSLFKRFRLKDSGPLGSGPFALEVRIEVFNVFNTPYLTVQGNAWRTVSSPAFGQVNAAGAARRGQLGLKLTW